MARSCPFHFGASVKATATSGQMENQLRSPGFTLVELIVVMLVLGILAAVFVPRSNNPAIILSTQAEQLAADIRYVQSLAMTQGWSQVSPSARRPYSINFDVATGYKLTTDNNATPVPHPSGTTRPGGPVGSISFAGDVSISPFPPSSPPISFVSFDNLGRPHTDADALSSLSSIATITMVSGSEARSILIYPETGMVRVQ